MSAPRIRVAGCSFISPEGFIFQEKASAASSYAINFGDHIHKIKPNVSITLIKPVVYPDLPDYSESHEDMNPDAYPSTLTLTTQPWERSVSPLHHLRNTRDVLKTHLEGFKSDFCRNHVFGTFPAACSQESFLTNFRIYLLNIAWLINAILATSTMIVTESAVETGWTHLRRFVNSVEF